MFLDSVNIGGQLKIGTGISPAVGEGCPTEQGQKSMVPCIARLAVFGGQLEFPTPYATVCIGKYSNSDSSPVSKAAGIVPGLLFPLGINNPYSLQLMVILLLGILDVRNNTHVGGDMIAQGHVMSNNGGHILHERILIFLTH